MSDRKLPPWVVETIAPCNDSSGLGGETVDSSGQSLNWDENSNFEMEGLCAETKLQQEIGAEVNVGDMVGPMVQCNDTEFNAALNEERELVRERKAESEEDVGMLVDRTVVELEPGLKKMELSRRPYSKKSKASPTKGDVEFFSSPEQISVGPTASQSLRNLAVTESSGVSRVPDSLDLISPDIEELIFTYRKNSGKGQGNKIMKVKATIKKKSRKEKRETARVNNDCPKSVMEATGNSLSDARTAQRKEANWKEAEELWAFTSKRGVGFEGEKEDILKEMAIVVAEGKDGSRS